MATGGVPEDGPAADRIRRGRRALPGALACAGVLAAGGTAALAASTATPSPAPTPSTSAPQFSEAGALPGLPGNGHIWSLAFDPDPRHAGDALAGTDNGVYQSLDGGQTWSQTALPGVTVWRVGFGADPQHTAFAGTATQGLWRSADAGATWTASSTGLGTIDVRAIGFGIAGLAVGTDRGVWMSSDNGLHWHAAGLGKLGIKAVVVSANAPRFTVIAGADAGDIGGTGFLFRSDDGGATWQLLQSGLPPADKTVVSDMAIGPLPANAQARPVVLVTSQGTYASGDGGVTWTSSAGVPTNPAPIVPTTAAWAPTDPNLVYAGADSGGSTGGDLLRSGDAGLHFQEANAGLATTDRQVEAIAVAVSRPPTVLVAIDPVHIPGQSPRIYRMVDSSVPSPSPIATEAGAKAPPTLPPTPLPTHTVPPVALRPAATPPSSGSGFFSGALGLPFPLSLEVLVILVAIWAALRWRQRRLEIEGPP